MEEKMKKVMENLKDQFGPTFDPPNQITPEALSILLYEMTKQIGEAFA
jgi:hypothetical protein